jgi:hypothetical protein
MPSRISCLILWTSPSVKRRESVTEFSLPLSEVPATPATSPEPLESGLSMRLSLGGVSSATAVSRPARVFRITKRLLVLISGVAGLAGGFLGGLRFFFFPPPPHLLGMGESF